MMNDFIEKVKGFFLDPVVTFRKARADSLETAFTYYFILLVISAILSTIVAVFGFSSMSSYQSIPGLKSVSPLIMFFGTIICGILGVFIGGAWLHIFVWAFGGKKGYIQTVKSIMYACTPALLLGWIPYIGFIGGLWGIVLEILGIRELQEVSTGRAIAVVIIAFVILILIIMVIAVAVFMPFMRVVSVTRAY